MHEWIVEATFHDKQDQDCLMNHVHLKVNPYKCDECSKRFYGSKNLKTHISKIHKNLNKSMSN